MILLNGVSGFNGPHREMDGALFKKIVYGTVLSLGGKVVSFQEPVIAQHYYYAEVELAGETLFILLNQTYPFIAFASSVTPFELTFRDHEQLSKKFREHYTVLLASELNEPLVLKEKKGKQGKHSIENENELNAAEIYNIRYWQTKRVGDVVFNYWD